MFVNMTQLWSSSRGPAPVADPDSKSSDFFFDSACTICFTFFSLLSFTLFSLFREVGLGPPGGPVPRWRTSQFQPSRTLFATTVVA